MSCCGKSSLWRQHHQCASWSSTKAEPSLLPSTTASGLPLASIFKCWFRPDNVVVQITEQLAGAASCQCLKGGNTPHVCAWPGVYCCCNKCSMFRRAGRAQDAGCRPKQMISMVYTEMYQKQTSIYDPIRKKNAVTSTYQHLLLCTQYMLVYSCSLRKIILLFRYILVYS